MLWWFVSVVQKLLQFNDTMQKLFLLIEVQDLCFIAIFLVKTNNVTVSNYKLQFSLHNWPERKQLFSDCGQQWCFSSDIGDQFSFISVQRQYFQFLFHFNLIYLKIDFYFNSVQLAYWNHFQHVFWGILNQKIFMYLDSLVTANSATHPDIFLAQLLLCQELEKELTLSSERIVRQTDCNDKVIIYNCLLLVDLCFLAARTNGRAYATVLRLSSVCLSVTICIVAKRCVLEQKLLLRAYRKSYMRNRLIPKWMTLTFV